MLMIAKVRTSRLDTSPEAMEIHRDASGPGFALAAKQSGPHLITTWKHASNRSDYRRGASRSHGGLHPSEYRRRAAHYHGGLTLQNVAAQVPVLQNVVQLRLHVGSIHHELGKL